MLRKISLTILAGMFLAFPIFAQAEKLEPPNLVEVRIDDQFVDKNDVLLGSEQVMSLIGTAKPDSEVYLYIFSQSNDEPLLAKSPVDKDGNWQYVLNQALEAGLHRIEADTHSGEDISAKVELLSFSIPAAKISPTTYLYIFGTALLVIVLVLLFVFKKKLS